MHVTVYDMAHRDHRDWQDALWSADLSAPPRVGESVFFQPSISDDHGRYEVADVAWTFIGPHAGAQVDVALVDVEVFVRRTA